MPVSSTLARPLAAGFLFVAMLMMVPRAWMTAADPPPPAGELRNPAGPYSAEDERKTFRLPPGFEAQLVASEPNIVDPVAMCFDERVESSSAKCADTRMAASGPAWRPGAEYAV